MPGSLKHLLNPLEDEGDIPVGTGFNPTGFTSDHELGNWDGYNGQYPRQSAALGPRPENASGYESDTPSRWTRTKQPSTHVPAIDGAVPVPPFDVLDPMIFDSQLIQQPESIELDDETSYGLDLGLTGWGDGLVPRMDLSYDSDSPQRSTIPSHEESQIPSARFVSSRPSAGSVTTVDEAGSVVCYGKLYDIEVKLIGDMATTHASLSSPTPEHQLFELKQQQNHVILTFPHDGTEFGHIRSRHGKTLTQVRAIAGATTEVVARKSALCEAIKRASKPAEALVKVDIGVYGPRQEASRVGNELSRGKLWLQEPDQAYRGDAVPYENPHFLQLKIKDRGLKPVVLKEKTSDKDSDSRKRKREKQLRKMVEEVYKSVEKSRHLDKVEGGERVTQELLVHQQEALGFMLERETGHINERYRLWQQVTKDGKVEYQHKITKATSPIEHDEKGGGILADDMGMGKSLSILALTMRTLDNAREWADELNNTIKSNNATKHSRSTLIVVASRLLITGWRAEIKEHLRGGLNVTTYHGQRRSKDLDDIRDSDIVLTTYKTLAVEYQKRDEQPSTLHQIRWYRVVLDEAHIIRRQGGSFYKSCNHLHANSRWCLTGTPIQNKPADIGSLFSFIRVYPFDQPSVFRRWISDAFEQMADDPELVKDRLVMLLGALCLRRTKEILHLPGVRHRIRTLDFTLEERERYDKAEHRLLRLVRQSVGATEDISKTSLFHVKLGLRILCSHGTFQKNLSWRRRTYMEPTAGALGPDRGAKCSWCEQPIPVLGLVSLERSGFDDRCAHVLCPQCHDDSSVLDQCPVCERWGTNPTLTLGAGKTGHSGVPSASGGRASTRGNREDYFRSQGHSTKMKKLVEDITVDLWTTKSIVFSCWTRTLDLLARHLEQAEIPYLRIDGGCPNAQRPVRLEEFEKGEDNPVLIMTTGTGAHGLNLTCANRIFIVELQWNPSVEYQAIARATRLGQKREVRVTRYMIRDTVEEGMQQQQHWKKKIAAIGFNEVHN